MLDFQSFSPSAGEMSLLENRRRPFVYVEQRPCGAHIQVFISLRCHFQMPVSPSIVFPASTKRKSGWHAAGLRGVIHHYKRKEAHDECGVFKKNLFTCVHHFNLNSSCFQPPDINQTGSHSSRGARRQRFLAACFIMASRPTAEKHLTSPRVGDKWEQLAHIVNKPAPLIFPRWDKKNKKNLLWFFDQQDKFVRVDKYFLNCPGSQGMGRL